MIIQGQSLATLDKERGIASTLAINMKIAAAVILRNQRHNPRFTYWHLDTNAGSGWNRTVLVDGSPIVFHKMADLYLQGIRREAWFCDIDRAAIDELLKRLGPWNSSSFPFQKDNEDVLELFAHRLRACGENSAHVMGSVLVDPNGWFYRDKEGVGAPIKRLAWFTAQFPKIDVILNLNTRSRRLMLPLAWYRDISPRDVLAGLNKQHWQIKRTHYGGGEYMLAIGRNIKTTAHRAVGFHDLDSEQGKAWMLMFEGRRQAVLDLEDGNATVSDVRGISEPSAL